jgi:hypothetical protein
MLPAPAIYVQSWTACQKLAIQMCSVQTMIWIQWGFYGDFMGISDHNSRDIYGYIRMELFYGDIGISDHSSNLIVGIYKNGTQ